MSQQFKTTQAERDYARRYYYAHRSDLSPVKSLHERFWENVAVAGENECWEWKRLTKNQYGRLKLNGKVFHAHHISYEIANGEIPEGKWILHKCDNPRCVNPNHLFAGTADDNNKDRANKGRNALGLNNGRCKISDDDVRTIRAMYSTKIRTGKIARIFNVSGHTIWTIGTYRDRKQVEEDHCLNS